MSDLTPTETDLPDGTPDVFVVRVDCSAESTRAGLLARLRNPDGDGMHTAFWRFETKDGGAVLAERYGGDVIIHADVCRAELGEDV